MSDKPLNIFIYHSKKLSNLFHYLPQHPFADPVYSRFTAMHKFGTFLQGILLIPQIKKLFFPWGEITFPPEIFSFLGIKIRNNVTCHALLPSRCPSGSPGLSSSLFGYFRFCHFPISPLFLLYPPASDRKKLHSPGYPSAYILLSAPQLP